MSTPFDDMSEDEMIERILINEEKIKLYKRVYKTILVVLMLDHVRRGRKGKRARKSFRGKV